jgi:hypothetical protein
MASEVDIVEDNFKSSSFCKILSEEELIHNQSFEDYEAFLVRSWCEKIAARISEVLMA